MLAMGRLIAALVIVAGLGGAVVPAAQAGPEAVADGWRVLETHGGARFQPAGAQSWWPVRTGSTIPAGSTVATGSSGFLIIARDGESITVQPNSRVALPGGATGQVRQTAGDLRYRITRVPDRRFSVETPYLSLLVKGTVFEVMVGDRGAEVEVSEGRVRVDAARGQFVELSPGQSARIAPGAQADLEFRAAPGSPFTTRSPRAAIAAAYTRPENGRVTGDRPPRPPQETARAARADSAAGHGDGSAGQAAPRRAGGMPRVEDPAAVREGGGDAIAASADGAPHAAARAAAGPGEAGVTSDAGRNSGVEIGFSDGRMWIDTARAQIAEARPRQDAIVPRQDTVVRSAPADPRADTVNDGSEAAPQPQPQMAAAAPGEDQAGGTAARPRVSTDTSDRTVQASRAGRGSGGGWRRSDTVVWTILLAVAATLWWRLRRSPGGQASGHGTGWRWPWQRSDDGPSGAGIGTASPGSASRRTARNGT